MLFFEMPKRKFFVDILPCAETINPDLYIQTLKTLQKHFRLGHSHKNVVGILLLP
jgi:hypothetical protein